jgi:hypothetical protein
MRELDLDVAPFPFLENTDRNGNFLAEFLADFHMRKEKLWTFRDRATDTLRQLDYFLIG